MKDFDKTGIIKRSEHIKFYTKNYKN